MSDQGGTDAESLKNAIDNISDINGRKIHIKEYHLKLVSITKDGASISTGKNSGLMTRMETQNQRNWLVKIHCINHRLQQTAKKVILENPFKDIDKRFPNNYYLLRNYGESNSEVKKATDVLGMQHFTQNDCYQIYWALTKSISYFAEDVASYFNFIQECCN